MLTEGKYILDMDGRTPIPCPDLEAWAAWIEIASKRGDKIVKKTKVNKKVGVSTVFLGLDHSFGSNGPPILFETMIFGGEHDGYCDRCATWTQAEMMHEYAVAMVTK